MIQVEVAYALPDEQVVRIVEGKPGMTVQEAIERSGILELHPEIDLGATKVGVFGKATKLDAVLYPGDRVEIYRPLIADPKEARKKRAARGKPLRKGGGKPA
jgi:putative ubiquitin-RnfH superfamily antitoxin RatB of RatAB toxin-antitoxin module